MKKKTSSWTSISVWLCFFFPVGICLLVKKVAAEKDRYVQNGKSLKILAIVLFCLIPVYIIMAVTGELEFNEGTNSIGTMIIMLLSFAVCGAFSFYKGNQFIVRGTRYTECRAQLTVQQAIDIDPIAIELRIPFDTVAADLQGLVDVGYLQNVHVNLIDRKVVTNRPVRPTRTVTCPHCGGKSDIEVGTAAKCEYCDSPLIL